MKKICFIASVLAIWTIPSFANEFVTKSKDLPFPVAELKAAGDLRKYYREQVQDLVYGAMTR